MKDVLEVSYTGDLLAHRRCPRAWGYEKYAQFQPYEQAQAMEGRLVHHGMEWLTQRFDPATGSHATASQLQDQLLHYFRVLWARGLRTGFQSKQETIDRVVGNLYPGGQMHPTVKTVIEGAKHTEYELRTVKKLVRTDFAGKTRMVLTGILDLVIQTAKPLVYPRVWTWTDRDKLLGQVSQQSIVSHPGDLEIWDYKGTRATTTHIRDYVIQLLTYAGLYGERVGNLPARCVLYFVNEPKREAQLVAIEIDPDIVRRAEAWTIAEAKRVRQTMLRFEQDPGLVDGGDLDAASLPVGTRVDAELKKQCTACGQRFDCQEYITHLGGARHPDVDPTNVTKN